MVQETYNSDHRKTSDRDHRMQRHTLLVREFKKAKNNKEVNKKISRDSKSKQDLSLTYTSEYLNSERILVNKCKFKKHHLRSACFPQEIHLTQLYRTQDLDPGTDALLLAEHRQTFLTQFHLLFVQLQAI